MRGDAAALHAFDSSKRPCLLQSRQRRRRRSAYLRTAAREVMFSAPVRHPAPRCAFFPAQYVDADMLPCAACAQQSWLARYELCHAVYVFFQVFARMLKESVARYAAKISSGAHAPCPYDMPYELTAFATRLCRYMRLLCTPCGEARHFALMPAVQSFARAPSS